MSVVRFRYRGNGMVSSAGKVESEFGSAELHVG